MKQITCSIHEDILDIGTKVFIPRSAINGVHEDVILGYNCNLVKDEKGTLLIIPTHYRLSILNIGNGSVSSNWSRNEFFLSYEEAKANAVEYKVDATKDEWFSAIGLTGEVGEERIDYDENCELMPCCSNISEIRNLLYDICITGKITGVGRIGLINALNNHEPPDNKVVLDKILAQLNIEWVDNDEGYVVEKTKQQNETNNNQT